MALCFCLFLANNEALVYNLTGESNGRYDACSVTLSDNRIWMFGGTDYSGLTGSIVIIDVSGADPTVSVLTDTPAGHPGARVGHACAYDIASNSIYVYGGRGRHDTTPNSMHVYNIEYDSWSVITSTGYMPPPRMWHSMLLWNNKLYVFGGVVMMYYGEQKPTNDLLMYHLHSGEWTSVSTDFYIGPRGYHSMTLVDFAKNGALKRALERSTSPIYWPESADYESPVGPPLGTDPSSSPHSIGFLVYGGRYDDLECSMDDAYVYFPIRNVWMSLGLSPPSPYDTSSYPLSLLNDGSVVGNVLTGREFDPARTQLPLLRHRIVPVNDKLYMFGGSSNGVYVDNFVEISMNNPCEIPVVGMDLDDPYTYYVIYQSCVMRAGCGFADGVCQPGDMLGPFDRDVEPSVWLYYDVPRQHDDICARYSSMSYCVSPVSWVNSILTDNGAECSPSGCYSMTKNGYICMYDDGHCQSWSLLNNSTLYYDNITCDNAMTCESCSDLHGCAWCTSSSSCTSSVCQGLNVTLSSECPVECMEFSYCNECASTEGCVWCHSRSSCIKEEKSNTCPDIYDYSSIIYNATECQRSCSDRHTCFVRKN